jgi:hypothetical protein
MLPLRKTNRRKAFVLEKRAHDRIRRKERIPGNTLKSSEGVTKSYCIQYMNRRVKTRDLKNIANHDLRNLGKKEIKSASTAWNRSAPCNKRSRQVKLHCGNELFCTKKPPKAEDNDNRNTHHQRCHIKNVQLQLFNDQSEAKFAYLHSMDDKAYVRPGTSEGFEKTKNVMILTACDFV